MNTPYSAVKTIPMVGPTLSRFVRTLIARDDEGGMMSVCTDSPVGEIGGEAPKAARSMSERRIVSFMLYLSWYFCSLRGAWKVNGKVDLLLVVDKV
jgi:hypothetical protein